MRGVTDRPEDTWMLLILFQSTLPMRGVTGSYEYVISLQRISIHTPHAGSDTVPPEYRLLGVISIHTPHAGSDGYSYEKFDKKRRFQSTLPMRGVTTRRGTLTKAKIFQSTLPMRGVTAILTKSFFYLLVKINK